MLKILFGYLSWGWMNPRTKVVNQMLQEIINNDPKVKSYDKYTIKFEGYPAIWVANYPYSWGNIYDTTMYPTVPMVYKFKDFVDKKIIEYYTDQNKEDLSIFKRIEKWNKERLLDQQSFDINIEATNIVEELLEIGGNLESTAARELATKIVKEMDLKNPDDINSAIDGLCDIIVYATGALVKLKSDPECAMQETLKEIESRTGKIINGKFVKDKSPEAQAQWYKADYNKCVEG